MACSPQRQHHGTGPSCPHAGVRACPLAPCGSRCRGNPTCLPQHITAKTRGQQATKGLHCPHGPHRAPHGAWLSAPRPERHPPGRAGGQSTWSCGNTGPGLLRVRDGGPWNWGSSGTKQDACLLSRKLGRGAGWSYQVRGNRGGQQRPTCRPTGPGPWAGPAVLRRVDAAGLGGPEAWEEPVHEGRPPGLGLITLQASRAGAEEPRPWMFTDGPHGGTGHLGASCTRGLTGLAVRTGCKACMRDQCRLFPFLSAPSHGPQRQHPCPRSLAGQQTPPCSITERDRKSVV